MTRLQASGLAALVFILAGCAKPKSATPGSPTTPITAASPVATATGGLVPASLRPNPSLTPGDVLTTDAARVCQRGYAKTVRNVPSSLKALAYKRYGILTHRAGEYEVDHLISLELGGSNSILNLWPEAYAPLYGAHLKDKLENALHAKVCAGGLDLATAQRAIANDWSSAYAKYLGPLPR